MNGKNKGKRQKIRKVENGIKKEMITKEQTKNESVWVNGRFSKMEGKGIKADDKGS